MKIDCVCEGCGTSFLRSLGQVNQSLKRGTKFYCSSECRAQCSRLRQEYNCLTCGSIVIRTPSTALGNVYCSSSCSAKGTNPTRQRIKKTVDISQRAYKLREERQSLKREVIDAYGGKCSCCGELEIIFLTLDHVNNDGKQHREKLGKGRSLYLWAKKNNYPATLQAYCWNCNIGKYHNGGTCPHKEEKCS